MRTAAPSGVVTLNRTGAIGSTVEREPSETVGCLLEGTFSAFEAHGRRLRRYELAHNAPGRCVSHHHFDLDARRLESQLALAPA